MGSDSNEALKEQQGRQRQEEQKEGLWRGCFSPASDHSLLASCFVRPLSSACRLLPSRQTIMEDPFIRNYVEDLLKKIRTQVRRKEDGFSPVRFVAARPVRQLEEGRRRERYRVSWREGSADCGCRCSHAPFLTRPCACLRLFTYSLSPCVPLGSFAMQVLMKLIQPYTRVRIPFISQRLNIPEKDVEQLLVTLILDGRISGYIDQVRNRKERSVGAGNSAGESTRPCERALCVGRAMISAWNSCVGSQVNQLLEVGDRNQGTKKYAAMTKWSMQLKTIHAAVLNKLV